MLQENGRRIDLLEVLDAMVRSDGAPSGLKGSISIGVLRDDREEWWSAKFGARTETSRSFLPSSDASLLLHNDPSAPKTMIFGLSAIDASEDIELLMRFVDRYVVERSFLSVRAGAKSKSTRRRS